MSWPSSPSFVTRASLRPRNSIARRPRSSPERPGRAAEVEPGNIGVGEQLVGDADQPDDTRLKDRPTCEAASPDRAFCSTSKTVRPDAASVPIASKTSLRDFDRIVVADAVAAHEQVLRDVNQSEAELGARGGGRDVLAPKVTAPALGLSSRLCT
jgi:hypothetical protein